MTTEGAGNNHTNGEDPPAKSKQETKDGVIVLDILWRAAVVFIGIPTLWILRAYEVVNMSFWHAVAGSVILLLIALGWSNTAWPLT
ncbi:hypothetical protein [Mycobacteroides abscessus]|uniref:hypothetical protein n=1 Tax=Mycobacteroides abscessus TaxID=36809 RepID=UPI000C26B04C|nr:hypothetical protein [Mycobacteroides abscessus]